MMMIDSCTLYFTYSIFIINLILPQHIRAFKQINCFSVYSQIENQLQYKMDDALVFSSKQKIKCIQFLTQNLLILGSDSSLKVFQIGTASNIFESAYPQQILPIKIEVIGENKMLVIQGKMGYNFMFAYNLQNEMSIKMIRKYETHMHGFCKMLNISNRYLLAINQDQKSIQGYNMLSGNKQIKHIFDDDRICQSVTGMQAGQQLKDKQTQQVRVAIYLAQQGCKIHKLELPLCGQSQEDYILETKQSIQIQNKQQIKIITSMLLTEDKLYCLIRKCESLYILQAQPTLRILRTINFKLFMPKNLTKHNHNIEGLTLMLTDHNKILRIKLDKDSQKVSTMAQLHQSKSIEYASSIETGICGCTQEKQFFYIQI